MTEQRREYNRVEIEGKLARDPDVKYFESGAFVVSFSVPVYQGKNQDGGYKPSVWKDVKAWGFEDAANLRKGDRVHVVGQFGQDVWNDRQTGEERKKEHIFVNRKFTGHEVYVIGDTSSQTQPDESPVDDYDSIPF